MSEQVAEQEAPRIFRRERALLELAADMIGEQVAQRIALPTYDAPMPETHEGEGPFNAQQLITIPNGDGVNAAVYPVAGGHALWPLSLICRIVTTGAGADRGVAIEYQTGRGTRYAICGAPAGISASETRTICWYVHAGTVAWPVEDAILAPLAQQHVYPGNQIAVRIANGQPGDVLDSLLLSAELHAL